MCQFPSSLRYPMTSLLSLYPSILVPVCSEWIRAEDLCFLDTAVCNLKLRDRFLLMLLQCDISNFVSEDDKSFHWLILRGLRLKKLNVWRWTSVIDALLQSRNLYCMEIELDLLIFHLALIKNICDTIVHLPESFDRKKLGIAGHFISELSLCSNDDQTIKIISVYCPNLKKITASKQSFILPIVDACQLDTISNCHLCSLIKREDYTWTYSCSLRRTFVEDQTAVCLGEGKYYHLTSLNCFRSMTEKDTDLLIPLLPNLTGFMSDRNQSVRLITSAAEQCRLLRYLKVCNAVDKDNLVQLLLHSSFLRDLHIHNFIERELIVDECIVVLSNCCPLLETCILKGCSVVSESKVSTLFKRCHYLAEFYADKWPCDGVLPFAENIESLIVSEGLSARKFGRRLKNFEMPNRVQEAVLCAVFTENPGLCSVKLTKLIGHDYRMIETMIQCCSLLKSLIFKDCQLEGTFLVHLGQLLQLTALSLYRMNGLTIESVSLMLENKSSSLLALTLNDCGVSGDMLSVIGSLCPALTSLDLTNNPFIENANVVNLLNLCAKLELVSLEHCPRITSVILTSVKSPSLKYIAVFGTGISKSDVVGFEGVTFSFNV